MDSQYGTDGNSFIDIHLAWDDHGILGINGIFDDGAMDTAGEYWSHATIAADGEWHEIVLDVTLNTFPSKRMNGLIDLYYDGTNIFTSNKVKYRTSENYKFEGLYFISYFGDASVISATPKDQYIDFTGFTINNGPLN
ncbi:MAG: hypothetical protein K9M03_04760 [Kiritimatiellales bacterium]|nr:hypothetical protein [Kiritimatiellales bacterium]